MKSVNMGLRVKIVPCEGFELRRFGGGEYLVVKKGDTTHNTIIDADILARLFVDLANGGLIDDGFNHGFGSFWRIEEVAETHPQGTH
jgi:hypothetical protein